MGDAPIVASPGDATAIAAEGRTFGVYEWRGSGPAALHVHHEDDEAWHVLDGTLEFRFADRREIAGSGTTVFVPAGVPHTYVATDDARYLVVLTRRLRVMIDELHETALDRHAEVYRRHASELLE